MSNKERIDFHTHTFLSDGALLPSELIQRAAVCGYRALAITDHADASNLEPLIRGLQRLLNKQGSALPLEVIIGVELTHVPPDCIGDLARAAKKQGAELVIVHGETIVEPVPTDTNRSAVEAPDVDILAHPGLLTLEDAEIAAERGCLIEITTRRGHSLTNGHVAQVCVQAGANMVVNTDTHVPNDLSDQAFAQKVACGAGLKATEVEQATVTTPRKLLARILRARRPFLST